MPFCSNCGKQTIAGEGRCVSCGAPIAADAVQSLTAELRRQRKQIWLIGIAIGVALAVNLWILQNATRVKPDISAPPPSASEQRQALPAPHPSDSAAASVGYASSPQPQPEQSPQQGVSSPNDSSNRTTAKSIDADAVQMALKQLAPHSGQATTSAQQSPVSSAAPSGSDHYPGSQPVNVENANLPDIGIPVAREVYTTKDTIPTVVSYYKQRYPDAQITEIDGQQIIAVDRPSATKVIAIGSTGSETRIAIVWPGN